MAGKMILDLRMPGNGLASAGPGILIPVVPAAMPQKHTSRILDLPDQLPPFHANCRSATLRTPGMLPQVIS